MGDRSADELLARWVAPGAALYVGVYEDATVGLAGATTFTRRGGTRPSARIECCYVEPDARGVGVGGALMQALVEWCTSQGAGDVDALALPGDRSTKQRLEAAGFTARLLTLNRSLD
jgi:GNAT superfamily N-acetyltransferase